MAQPTVIPSLHICNKVDLIETNCVAETFWFKNLENPDGFGIPSQFGILQAFQCRLL